MRYCPQCRTEYVDEVTHCSDCGAELVDYQQSEALPADIQWVRLASLANEVQGILLREELEKRGIRTMLKKDVFVSGFGHIFVDEPSLKAAQEIHAEVIGNDPKVS